MTHVGLGVTRNWALAAVIGLAMTAWAGAGTNPAATAKEEAAKDSEQYAGSETCKGCHEELFKQGFEKTAHYQTMLKGGKGCESCHGPGAEHVAAGGDVSKIVRYKDMARRQASQRCLECHGKSEGQSHFAASAHAGNDVGCLDCHSPHRAKADQYLLVKAQPELCYSCHNNTRAEFAKPFRHRVDDGLVQCSDCHNAHGTSHPRQARAAAGGDAVCMKCHADKQGPYVYEHVPVKTEGCSSCHTPHGSTNARLLRVSQVNLLCLQCHSFPAAGPSGPVHNQSQKYQACTMCHPAIHGSNFNVAFLK